MPLTLRAELRLRVFENKVLRMIFGTKRDEITREWRKSHNAELHAYNRKSIRSTHEAIQKFIQNFSRKT